MINLSRLTVSEMIKDKAETLEDIAVCKKALLLGITTYGEGESTAERLRVNKEILATIKAELLRRDPKEFA